MSAIDLTLQALTRLAWCGRLDPKVYMLARKLTDREASRQAKMEAIVDHMHRQFQLGRQPDPVGAEALTGGYVDSIAKQAFDADDACLYLASAAMSVGIRCRFVGARYGQSWTCWVDYEVGNHWETIDPLRQRPDREPDERVTLPDPGAP